MKKILLILALMFVVASYTIYTVSIYCPPTVAAQVSSSDSLVGKSFLAYPSKCPHYAGYDRTHPLECDRVEFDETGLFDTSFGNWCFRADRPMTVAFHFNMEWQDLEAGDDIWAGLYVGNNNGEWTECAGHAIRISASGNQGLTVSRTIQLNKGDYVQAMPVVGRGGKLIQSVYEVVTANFLQGTILRVD